jgi:hypothetical protein
VWLESHGYMAGVRVLPLPVAVGRGILCYPQMGVRVSGGSQKRYPDPYPLYPGYKPVQVTHTPAHHYTPHTVTTTIPLYMHSAKVGVWWVTNGDCDSHCCEAVGDN